MIGPERESDAWQGLVLDLDGVLWVAGAPAEGATRFIRALQSRAMPFAILTNTCVASVEECWQSLAAADLSIRREQVLTAGSLTGRWLENARVSRIMFLGAPNPLPDLPKGIRICSEGPVDAVVVGDLFAYYDRRALNAAAKAISQGAVLLAMQRNRSWSDGNGAYVDNGFWVAGLEYVTNRLAVVASKPSPEAYLAAVATLADPGPVLSRVLCVSDDPSSDLKGAKAAGLCTVYLGTDANVPGWVDHHIASLEELAILLWGRI